MKASLLKNNELTTGGGLEETFDEVTAEAELSEQERQRIDDQVLAFPEAYGRCMGVFIATDPRYRKAMSGLLGAIYMSRQAEDEREKEQIDSTIRRIADTLKSLGDQYFNEADAIRAGLLTRRGAGTNERILKYADQLRECPPSAGAMAVLAFSPNSENIQVAFANLGKKGAAAKRANDPKQHAKEDVYKRWQAWQAGKESYEGQAAFARAMLVEWSNVLKSQPSIEAWCRQWKRNENMPLIEPAQ